MACRVSRLTAIHLAQIVHYTFILGKVDSKTILIYFIIILMSQTVITNYKLYMKNFWFKLNFIFRISSQLANSQSTYTKLIQFETESQRLSQIIEQTQLSRRSKRVSIFYNHTVLIKLLNKLMKKLIVAYHTWKVVLRCGSILVLKFWP